MRVISRGRLNEEDFKALRRLILERMLLLYGLRGLSHDVPRLLDTYPERGMAILACSNRTVSMIRVALASLEEFRGEKILPYVIKITGTYRRAFEVLRSYMPEDLRMSTQ